MVQNGYGNPTMRPWESPNLTVKDTKYTRFKSVLTRLAFWQYLQHIFGTVCR